MRIAVVACLIAAVLLNAGCASICYPNRQYVNPDRRGNIDKTMRILNIPWDILTLGTASAIDMATGAAWKPLPPGQKRTEDGKIINIPR